MRRRVAVTLALTGLVAITGTTAALAQRGATRAARRSHADAPRIRVQVVNATKTRGLGRRAMLHLRDRGFDVVDLGTSRTERDSTLVIDRSGHPDYARQVAAAFGDARVEARRDSSRYLDVTVLVGRTWRPPAKPFYP